MCVHIIHLNGYLHNFSTLENTTPASTSKQRQCIRWPNATCAWSVVIRHYIWEWRLLYVLKHFEKAKGNFPPVTCTVMMCYSTPVGFKIRRTIVVVNYFSTLSRRVNSLSMPIYPFPLALKNSHVCAMRTRIIFSWRQVGKCNYNEMYYSGVQY